MVNLRKRPFEGANPGERACRVILVTGHGVRPTVTHREAESVFERFKNLGERYRGRGAGEGITALHPTRTIDESKASQFLQDIRYERPAQAELLGDSSRRAGFLVKEREYQEGVIGLATEQCHNLSSLGFWNPHHHSSILSGEIVSVKCYFVETVSQVDRVTFSPRLAVSLVLAKKTQQAGGNLPSFSPRLAGSRNLIESLFCNSRNKGLTRVGING